MYGKPYLFKGIVQTKGSDGQLIVGGCEKATLQATTITFYQVPSAVISGDAAVCAGTDPQIKISFANGSAPYRYKLSVNNDIKPQKLVNGSVDLLDITTIKTDSGVWNIRVFDLMNAKCAIKDSFKTTLLVAPLPTFSIQAEPNNTVCKDTPLFLKINNTSYSNYLWSDGRTGTQIVISTAASTTSPTNYVVTVTDNSALKCTNTDEIQISVQPNPTPQIVGDNTVCQNAFGTIFQNGHPGIGTTHEWTTSDPKIGLFDLPNKLDSGAIAFHWDVIPGKYKLFLKEVVGNCFGLDTSEVDVSATKQSVNRTTIYQYDYNNNHLLSAANNNVCYQWGYTSKSQINGKEFLDETRRTYLVGNYDTTTYCYWVDTWKQKAGGGCTYGPDVECKTRTYFNHGCSNWEPNPRDPSQTPVDSIPFQNDGKLHFRLFPNPNSGDFTLQVDNPDDGKIRYDIFDRVGRLVSSNTAERAKGPIEEIFQLENKADGLYFLRVITDSGQVVSKPFVVQRN